MKKIKLIFSLLLFSVCAINAYSQVSIVAVRDTVREGSYSFDSAWIIRPSSFVPGKLYPLWVHIHGRGLAVQNCNCHLNSLAGSNSDGGAVYWFFQNVFTDSYVNPVTGSLDTFIVVAPQDNGNWSVGTPNLQFILRSLIEWKKLPIDTNRIYLEGLSAGAQGLFDYAGGWSSLVSYVDYHTPAAIVPMSMATTCSYPEAENIAAHGIQVWGFGSLSDLWGIRTAQMVDSVNLYAPGKARFTSYSGGHCCWGQFTDPRYKETINGQSMNIYQWAAQFSRGLTSSTPTPAPTPTPTPVDSVWGADLRLRSGADTILIYHSINPTDTVILKRQ